MIAFIFLVQSVTISAFSQDWIVPSDRKSKLSPFAFTEETRQNGERLYSINCKSCHGVPSKGNYITTLSPVPGDPASEKYQNNLDGELYYKIWEGRVQMPSFKNILSPSDVWSIISYVRTFNKSYVQEVMKIITSSAYPGSEIGIRIFLNDSRDKISARATATYPENVVPVSGAGMRLYVKRTFGLMTMDEEKTTDESGVAVFNIPEGLMADTAGNIMVSARFTDAEIFGEASKDTVLQAGTKITPVSLTAGRAMWNVVRKAPVWIILTYSLGVLGVWAFIFIILFRLRDIYTIGNHLTRSGTEE